MGWYLWTLDVRKQGLVGGEKNALLDLAVRGRDGREHGCCAQLHGCVDSGEVRERGACRAKRC